MTKKRMLFLWLCAMALHSKADIPYSGAALNSVNNAFDYANKGWLQRLIFVVSGSLALAVPTYLLAGNTHEIVKGVKVYDANIESKKALSWCMLNLSFVLATHYAWNRWLPAKELRGVGAMSCGLILFIPFMVSKKDAVLSAAMLLASALGAAKVAKTLEEWNEPKKTNG